MGRGQRGGSGPGEVQAGLAELALFDSLDDDALAALAGSVEPIVVPGGEVLMRQGDEADCAYVVLGGRLRILVTAADGIERAVGEVGRGEMVGEMALLTEERRSATVVAVRDSHLVRLPGDALAALFAHPVALRSVTTQLLRRLRDSMLAGPHRSPVATVAVVPLGDAPALTTVIDGLIEALAARVPSLAAVGSDDATADLGPPAARTTDDLEHDHALVVYRADPTPTGWTDRCLRHADLVLLVADAAGRPDRRTVEQGVAERQRSLPVRTELVLVHRPATTDPRATASWLEPRDLDRHHHVRVDRPQDVERVARFLLDRPITLVLSGGGARGMAEIGALRALEEAGVPVDAVCGTSAGALVAGAVARGWGADRIEASFRAELVGSRPLDPTFPAVAVAAGRTVTDKLRAASGDLGIEDLWRPYFCISTNLSHARPEVHRRGPVWRAVRASFAIPGVFPPVRHHGDVLVDGGLLDNLPVGQMRAEHDGAFVIAVDVGARHDLPAGGLPDTGVVSGWPRFWALLLPWRRGREPVNILRVMTRLTELGAETDDDVADLTIRPEVADLAMLDFARFDELVARGHDAARAVVGPWVAERVASAPGGTIVW